jgi:hypothetical protein
MDSWHYFSSLSLLGLSHLMTEENEDRLPRAIFANPQEESKYFP